MSFSQTGSIRELSFRQDPKTTPHHPVTLIISDQAHHTQALVNSGYDRTLISASKVRALKAPCLPVKPLLSFQAVDGSPLPAIPCQTLPLRVSENHSEKSHAAVVLGVPWLAFMVYRSTGLSMSSLDGAPRVRPAFTQPSLIPPLRLPTKNLQTSHFTPSSSTI